MLDVTAHSQSIQLGELGCQWDIRWNLGFNLDAKTGSDGKNFFFPLSLEATEDVRDTQPWLGDETMAFFLFGLLLLTDSFLIYNIVSYMWSLGFCDVMIVLQRNVMTTKSFLIYYNAFCSHVCCVPHESQILFDLLVSTLRVTLEEGPKVQGPMNSSILIDQKL
jgi:hypothetical protein